MEIGSKLKDARNSKGLTQEQAAEALGVSRQTISNWENNRSYPDIISVIKMSGLYSVSLDHLLKEEKPMNEEKSMNQTYQEFLEESTNTVRAKRRLEKAILFLTYFLVWAAAMVFFWQTNGPVTSQQGAVVFRWILLPAVLLAITICIAKNNYWGRGNWFAVLMAAVTYLTVPYTEFVEFADGPEMAFTFCFPNFRYMSAGIIIAACGLCIGAFWNRRAKKKESDIDQKEA